jgi:hypothetical protein
LSQFRDNKKQIKMTKEEKAAAAAAAAAQTANEESQMTAFDDGLDFGEGLEGQMIEVSASYLSMEAGEVRKFVYLGRSTATFEGEERPVVNLIGQDRNSYIAANVVLLNVMARLTPPCPIVVSCLGKAAGTKYFNYKVMAYPPHVKAAIETPTPKGAIEG